MKENKRKSVLMVVVLFFGMCVAPSLTGLEETIPRFDGDITVVSIQPSAQTVEKGEWFNVGIYVEPSEPIRGASVDIYFDPTLIQACAVYGGNLFQYYYPILSFPGTIDNINGEIIGIYTLILGSPGTGASDPGYLANISFIAQQEIGTSPLDLQNVIIADINDQLLPSTVIDGEVTIDEPPQITNVMLTTSEPLDTEPGFGWENFSCTVTDNTGVDEVKLVLTGDTITEYIMTKDGDDYNCNIIISSADEYTHRIWANDTVGYHNTSTSEEFALPMNEDVYEPLDGKVHFMDLVAVSSMYGQKCPGYPDPARWGWVRADVDNNGHVHFMDLVAVSGHYGEIWK